MAYTYNYKLNGEETIFKPQQQLFIFEFSVISTALKFLIRERHLICMKCFFEGYDSGEKKRIPAWCDRILYRDSRSSLVAECNLEYPVVSSVLQ